MLKAIVFDFDGVLCESVEIKTQAFRKLFASHPERLEEVIDFHMRNGGLSRFAKFEIIYRDILKKPLPEEEMARLAREFVVYSREAVIAAPMVRGAMEFLEEYSRKILLFVASGTPETEMVEIVKAKGLGAYFRGVFGSPRLKADIVRTIFEQYALKAAEVIFVGDSLTDHAAAQQTGLFFVGRVVPDYFNPFEEKKPDFIIQDIHDLKFFILKSHKIC